MLRFEIKRYEKSHSEQQNKQISSKAECKWIRKINSVRPKPNNDWPVITSLVDAKEYIPWILNQSKRDQHQYKIPVYSSACSPDASCQTQTHFKCNRNTQCKVQRQIDLWCWVFNLVKTWLILIAYTQIQLFWWNRNNFRKIIFVWLCFNALRLVLTAIFVINQ